MSSEYQQRFGGIARLYGESSLTQFANSHVCVIGIGGVGSWAVEALARSGIGQITLIDMDDVCITNTNRQLHALQGHVGQLKTEVMAARIRLINPECQVHIIDDFITPDNLAEYLTPGYDYVIDAIDSIKAKTALLSYCKRHKQPIITTGGAGGQKDPTQIRIIDLAKTTQDPLAARVRADLRRHYGFPRDPKKKFGIACVYSTEQLTYPDQQGGVCQTKSESDGVYRMDCANGFGAVTVVTATFGFVAVSHVLNKLSDKQTQ
jgi:tRNA A37 threonylcarbamoyladenosine dehydratase